MSVKPPSPFVKKPTTRLSLALGAFGSIAATGLSRALLAAVPVQTLQAQTASSCAAAWSASQVYTGGNTASENGVNYLANWWTQGNDPASNSGGAGSRGAGDTFPPRGG